MDFERGLLPAPKLVAALKLPAPSPKKIDTLAELKLATARSCLPSPLKSPTATEKGLVPAPKLVAALKLPAPSPKKIDTLFELKLATARSCLPSPLKSPTATEKGLVPAPKLVAAAKLTGVHVTGVVTVNGNVFVVAGPPPLKA